MGTRLVFFIPSAVLLLLALGLFFSRRAFAQRANRTDGVVVDYAVRKRRTQGRWRLRQHPVLQYTVDGQSYRLTANVGTTAREYPMGTELTILYRASDPGDAFVSTTMELYLGAILLAIFGGVALVCGVAFATLSR